MRNYMKKKFEKKSIECFAETLNTSAIRECIFTKRKIAFFVVSVMSVVSIILGQHCFQKMELVALSEEIPAQIVTMPVAATSSKKATISIPNGTVKANPFLPYRDIEGTSTVVNDVPMTNLVEPPDTPTGNPDAIRVMDTIVSGILFDKFSPSAILNIEGNDYLVKKGDTVNNYKIVNIAQDSVTVQLGSNVYKAGIGEILTEGVIQHNEVSNLSNKFGGVR